VLSGAARGFRNGLRILGLSHRSVSQQSGNGKRWKKKAQ
jgi:hypothetical protein